MGQIGIQRPFLLLARHVLRIARKYDRLWSSLIKLQGNGGSDVTSYDVSVKVGDTIYVVLYTPALGEDNLKYAAGRDLLVLVGKNTITYNDILGRSFAVPIESHKPAANLKQSKSVSRAAE